MWMTLLPQPLLAWARPTRGVQIGFDPEYAPDAGGRPDLSSGMFPALVDTGAIESCIDSALAREPDLPVVDRTTVAGVHGATEVNLHIAHIYVPGLDWMVYGEFAGVHLAAGGQPHLALMGRTFLRDFTLTDEGETGRVTIERA